MKFRIKAITNKNGNTYYYPEYKEFLFWYRFKTQGVFNKWFESKEECERYLDKHIKRMTFWENKSIIIKTEIFSVRGLE